MKNTTTLTEIEEMKWLWEKFVPGEHGAHPHDWTCGNKWIKPGFQMWYEAGTIDGKTAVVFYVFENCEIREDGADMPFDFAHVSDIEIDTEND